MGIGSDLFINKPVQERFIRPGGARGEVGDLRRDLRSVEFLAAMTVQQWNAPLAGGVATLLAAAVTVAEVVELGPDDLLAPALADMADDTPRQVTFTTSGSTPADAPANAVVTGRTVNGDTFTETVALAQTAATVLSTYFYGDIESIVFEAADGTDASVSIGTSAAIGLAGHLQSRAGAAAIMMEIEDGSVKGPDALAGTYALPPSALPNGSYAPGVAADGVKDYAIYYEFDAKNT